MVSAQPEEPSSPGGQLLEFDSEVDESQEMDAVHDGKKSEQGRECDSPVPAIMSPVVPIRTPPERRRMAVSSSPRGTLQHAAPVDSDEEVEWVPTVGFAQRRSPGRRKEEVEEDCASTSVRSRLRKRRGVVEENDLWDALSEDEEGDVSVPPRRRRHLAGGSNRVTLSQRKAKPSPLKRVQCAQTGIPSKGRRFFVGAEQLSTLDISPPLSPNSCAFLSP